MGAAQVVVIDQIPERLELARRFGADHTLSLRAPRRGSAAVKSSAGWGADVVCIRWVPQRDPEGLRC
jgi:threonine dehydrogenase-like Zn-dependent dehydrogenase